MWGWSQRKTKMLDNLEDNRTLGRDSRNSPARGGGLGNTNPVATKSFTGWYVMPLVDTGEPRRGKSDWARENLMQVLVAQPESLVTQFGLTADAVVVPRSRSLRPEGPVVLFQRIMGDWGFSDKDAATLLGFEVGPDIREIYLGIKPVRHRDAKDRLRAVLRIAADLDALFREVAAIQDWLSEPQRYLAGATPRSLLAEGSMENLLRVKDYVAYLSGR